MKSKAAHLLIRGEKWKAFIYDEISYADLHGADSEAITLPDEKQIHFMPDAVTRKRCLHELFHAYVSTLHLDAAEDLTNSDFEEALAYMFEEHMGKCLKQSLSLHRSLRRSLHRFF